MEDDKKGEAPNFKVADIEKSKAGQSDLELNVHETVSGRLRKHNAKIGDWVGKHHKTVVIILIAVAVVTVGILALIIFVPQWTKFSQEQNQNRENTSSESISNIPANTPFTDTMIESDQLLNNDSNNASKVQEYYKNKIDEALSKNDIRTAYTLIELEADLFERNGMDRESANALVDIEQTMTNQDLRDFCSYRIHMVAKRLGDAELEARYRVKDTDSDVRKGYDASEKYQESLRATHGGR